MIFDKVEKKKYRHELKYICTAAQLALIQGRISHLIPLDSHVGETGMYSIRSLYFDDYYNRCYYENENGTDPREKFRIRIYNGSAHKISLECKRKERGKTHKNKGKIPLFVPAPFTRREKYATIPSKESTPKGVFI